MRIEGSTLGIGAMVTVTSSVVAAVVWALVFFAWKGPTENRFGQVEARQQTISEDLSKIREDVSYIRGLLEQKHKP